MQRTYLLVLLASAMAVLITSCGQPPAQEAPAESIEEIEETPETPEESEAPDPEVSLPTIDGCYASNTDLSITGNSVLNVLDGNPNTHWRSPKGSGMYEALCSTSRNRYTLLLSSLNTNWALIFSSNPKYGYLPMV